MQLRYPVTTKQKQQPPDLPAAAKLTKDSLSESKIWMVPPASSRKGDTDADGRRMVSFRWPMRSGKDGEEEGGVERKSGSEADWGDVETGSGGGNSVVSSLTEERPSFARRTLLWGDVETGSVGRQLPQAFLELRPSGLSPAVLMLPVVIWVPLSSTLSE
ncbi:hypothetical protein ZWY2020_024431 [Hordeum vulgare]|nr:hypothetical protein ZWY2020_024431 [Hordeum vulgare]